MVWFVRRDGGMGTRRRFCSGVKQYSTECYPAQVPQSFLPSSSRHRSPTSEVEAPGRGQRQLIGARGRGGSRRPHPCSRVTSDSRHCHASQYARRSDGQEGRNATSRSQGEMALPYSAAAGESMSGARCTANGSEGGAARGPTPPREIRCTMHCRCFCRIEDQLDVGSWSPRIQAPCAVRAWPAISWCTVHR
jgi:hypothetical protein